MRIDPKDLAGAGRERHDNGMAMRFCWCPPGRFHMGRLPEPLSRLQPFVPVDVTLSQGFWMGKFEVTQAQWQRVMGVTLREQRARDPSQPRPVGDETMRDHVGEGPDYPIYLHEPRRGRGVLPQAHRGRTRGGPARAGVGVPAPDRGQWEFACRAGTTTATAFGDRLSSTQANFDGTHPLRRGARPDRISTRRRRSAAIPPTPGVCTTCTATSGSGAATASRRRPAAAPIPSKPAESESLGDVFRGGCWHNGGTLCLSTSRAGGDVTTRGSGLGFRVALVPTGS